VTQDPSADEWFNAQPAPVPPRRAPCPDCNAEPNEPHRDTCPVALQIQSRARFRGDSRWPP
jgi:hypothetical protein